MRPMQGKDASACCSVRCPFGCLPRKPRLSCLVRLAVASICLLSLVHVFSFLRSVERGLMCHGNMGQVVTGLRMYAQDYDERVPPVHSWMNRTLPYCGVETVFHCPEVWAHDPDGYGYALEASMAGKRLDRVPAGNLTPFVFDSNLTSKNAVAPFRFGIADPPRHRGRNVIGYVDGHVAPTRAR